MPAHLLRAVQAAGSLRARHCASHHNPSHTRLLDGALSAVLNVHSCQPSSSDGLAAQVKDETIRNLELVSFLKNLALFGSLLFWAGPVSPRRFSSYKLD